jgi:hypothetical protein
MLIFAHKIFAQKHLLFGLGSLLSLSLWLPPQFPPPTYLQDWPQTSIRYIRAAAGAELTGII